MKYPNCCGSEDGDVVYGVDPGIQTEVVIQVWKCNTCGVVTYTDTTKWEYN